MTTCLGKSCSFGLPRVPFVNCCQFMYLVIFLLVLRAGCGIWLYQFSDHFLSFYFKCKERWRFGLGKVPRCSLCYPVIIYFHLFLLSLKAGILLHTTCNFCTSARTLSGSHKRSSGFDIVAETKRMQLVMFVWKWQIFWLDNLRDREKHGSESITDPQCIIDLFWITSNRFHKKLSPSFTVDITIGHMVTWPSGPLPFLLLGRLDPRPTWHGIWYGLAGMTWYMVWSAGHGMV